MVHASSAKHTGTGSPVATGRGPVVTPGRARGVRRLLSQLRALALLALQALILQPIRRIRNLGSSGESRFLAAYVPERLLPLTPEERESRDIFGACIHCGLCDSTCEALFKSRRSRAPSLSAVAIGYSRSMPEYPFASVSLEELAACDACDECEAICPMEVPLKRIMAEMRAHAGRLDEAGVGHRTQEERRHQAGPTRARHPKEEVGSRTK